MAEILGVVTSIITLAELGFKFVSGFKHHRDSVHNTTTEIHQLDRILKDVQSSNIRARRRLLSGQKLSPDEHNILAMVRECEKLAKQLRKAIYELTIRDGARSRTIETVRVLTKGLLNQNDIQALRIRLNDMDQRIRESIRNAMEKQVHISFGAMSNALDFFSDRV